DLKIPCRLRTLFGSFCLSFALCLGRLLGGRRCRGLRCFCGRLLRSPASCQGSRHGCREDKADDSFFHTLSPFDFFIPDKNLFSHFSFFCHFFTRVVLKIIPLMPNSVKQEMCIFYI